MSCHQFLFQCLSSRNIPDNPSKRFRPQFYYDYRGDTCFHREGFCLTYLFQHVGCGNPFWVLRELNFLLRYFFVLKIGKQKDCNFFYGGRLELRSAAPRVTLTPLSCSPNFPRAEYLDIRTLTHELIVKFRLYLQYLTPYYVLPNIEL